MRVINIEGIDAVGKETVSKALEKTLQEKGYCVKRVSFPIYEGSIGKAIKEILLNDKIPAPSLDPNLISPFYTMDRLSYFKCNIDDLINNYDYVIMDRSFYSNLMYQASKYYISDKQKSHPKDFLGVNKEHLKQFGMSVETLTKIFDWISKNYQWEIIETGLYRCDNMFTFVLGMSEEDNKRQLDTREEVDTNEKNRCYLEGCKEFVSKLLSNEHRWNVKKFIDYYAYKRRNLNRPYFSKYLYNAAYYYLDNVEAIEVTHVDNQDDIPVATLETVGQIIKMMIDNDMFDKKGDDDNG